MQLEIRTKTMELQDRLFSENTEEVLYSVLMDEDEYALYSDFCSLFSKDDDDDDEDRLSIEDLGGHAGLLGSAGIGAGGGYLMGRPDAAVGGTIGSLYGRHKGFKKAVKADEEGESEAKVKRIAENAGAIHGGVGGAAACGAIASGVAGLSGIAAYKALKKGGKYKLLDKLTGAAKHNKKLKKALIAAGLTTAGLGAGIAGVTGAAGGAYGASAKTKEAISKRHDIEDYARRGKYKKNKK
jgi:hypothetical protein